MTFELEHRVAQRFLVAEILTKQWLMGVRRGWLSLLKPNIRDWKDVFSAFDRLIGFVRNLEEQVLLVRRGPYTSSPYMSDGKELRAAFKALKDVLVDQRMSAEFWHGQATGGPGHFVDRKEDGEKMFQIYRDNFAGTLTTHIKTRRNPAKGRWNDTRSAEITELLDNILELLRADAKRLDDAMRAEEEHGITVTRENFAEPAFREFSFGHMKVLVVAPDASGNLIKDYVRALDRAHTLTSRKGFGKLWYGFLILKSSQHEKFTEEEKAAYAEYGYANMESRSGVYHSGADNVVLTTPPDDAERVIIHELGHRLWFKFLTPANRARFNALVQTNPSKKVRDFPSGPTDEQGIEKPVLPVSDYGRNAIEEAFAEVFERYVSGKDMNRDQLESFRSVLASEDEKDSLAHQVVSRFLHAYHQ